MMMAAAGAGGAGEYVEDLFQTYVYTGTGSVIAIDNGVDLSTEGGMVWCKFRDTALGSGSNAVFDTERGINNAIYTNSTAAEANLDEGVEAFNADGFDLGAYNSENGSCNYNTARYASWTFRKAPGFFDVVTYTGTGSAHAINHSLGSTPGCIMIKNLDAADAWKVYHRSNTAGPETDYLVLNTTAATVDDDTMWNDTAPSSTQFTVGTHTDVNTDTENYVAYLFAHDDQSFGTGGNESIIQCGSYTGDGTTSNVVSVGWEPQYVMIKRAVGGTGSWITGDIMRGMPISGVDEYLEADTSNAIGSGNYIDLNPDGFEITNSGWTEVNNSGDTYIYIAIRRPMKTPEAGTEVFAGDYRTGGFTAGFPVDMAFTKDMYVATDWELGTRLVGPKKLATNNADAEATDTDFVFDSMTGWYNGTPPANYQSWMFKRASKFMDVVCYTGTGSAHTEAHGLTVTPEMIIVKNRSTAALSWGVYHKDMNGGSSPEDYAAHFDLADAPTANDTWFGTAPTSSVFTVGARNETNKSGDGLIAYLFATLEGISKVGSYTADATLTTIDCGFAAGARFILIKRTDDAGDWYLYDSARGIVAGNDKYLLLNDDAIQVADTDYIDQDNSGFQITEEGSTTINIDTAEYIFLAIA
jgi:hypothetical protein